MASVTLEGIRKSYERTEILKGIDLTIEDGSFLSLLGPSGCGKSTLLRIIAGLERQNSGHVRIGDDVVDAVRPSERNLSMVFQSYALYPHLSVADNIAVPLRMRRLSTLQRMPLIRHAVPGTHAVEREIRAEVARTAEQLGLGALMRRKPGQLSGGQRQRVAVGRAMVRQPRAFLLDEPLSNLDAKLRVHMRTEITQLHRALGATFIYVTHDQAEAMTMSDRIAVMAEGEILQVGTPDQIYDEPACLRVAEFIGSPKINVLNGTVDDAGTVRLGGCDTGCAATAAPGSGVSLGIRPEAIALRAPDDAGLRGRLAHTENLGADVFVHLAVEGCEAPVVVRLSQAEARRTRLGDTVGLDFAPAAARLFAADGRRIAPRIGVAAHV